MATTGEILRVVLEYDIPNTSETLNVFTFRIADGDPVDSDVLDDFQAWANDNWGVVWADFACGDATILNVIIDVLNLDGTVARNIGTAVVGLAGTATGDISGPADGGYILAYTANPKSRGSKYVPGLGDVDVVNNLIQAEAVADLAALVVVLYSAFTGDTSLALYAPGVLSRAAAVFRAFAGGGFTTDVPCYQRRRKPNSGS